MAVDSQSTTDRRGI